LLKRTRLMTFYSFRRSNVASFARDRVSAVRRLRGKTRGTITFFSRASHANIFGILARGNQGFLSRARCTTSFRGRRIDNGIARITRCRCRAVGESGSTEKNAFAFVTRAGQTTLTGI
jgi:hypothetical protein